MGRNVWLVAVQTVTLVLFATGARAESYNFSLSSLFSSGIGTITAGAGLPRFLFNPGSVLTIFKPYCLSKEIPEISNIYSFAGDPSESGTTRLAFLDEASHGSVVADYRDLCSFVATSSQGRDRSLVAMQQRLRQDTTRGAVAIVQDRVVAFGDTSLDDELASAFGAASGSGGGAPLPETGLLLSIGLAVGIVYLIIWKRSRVA